jgi:hypothetical protein
MLRRVTSPSFGNTNFDATMPLSVTFIMTQCDELTKVISTLKIPASRNGGAKMDNSPVIDIVASSPRQEDMDKLEPWYQDVHVPMLMKYGVKSAERFKALTDNSDYPAYLNMYHYADIRGYDERYSPQASAEISKDLQASWPNGHGVRWHVWYIEHKSWSTSGTVALNPGMIIHIVGVNGPATGKEADFNEWYDNTHVPWLMKTGTISQSVRYRITQPGKDYPAYLAVYYFDNQKKYETFLDHPERVAAVKELNEHWPNGIGSMWRVQYKVIRGWKK